MDRPSEEQTSIELLRRVQGGEDAALDRLLERYLPALRAWASRRLPNWARDAMDTSDIVQESLLHAFRHVREFEPQHDGALQAYLRQAVRNRIRDELRKAEHRHRRVTLDSQKPGAGPSPLDETIGMEAFERYEAALERLDAADREAIIARMELRQSWQEVAQALDKPSPDAARMAVTRALKRLAEEMAREK